MIHVGSCLDILPTLPDKCIDSIVTDPPYELGFMGKKWDSSGIAHNVDVWRECLRVLKPGGHLLAFGGTRTYHRMACAIEDAGFEIRDCLQWLYGSGFPKSHNVSKAIDKAAGATREVVEYRTINCNIHAVSGSGSKQEQFRKRDGAASLTAPANPEAQQWDGWGTALKPAWESVLWATKPVTIQAYADTIGSCLCQLYARIVEVASQSNPSDGRLLSSARTNAEWPNNIPGASLDLTGMSRSELVHASSLNTVSSWLRTLVGICTAESTFTTETESSMITGLKTLSSFLSANTLDDIIRDLGHQSDEQSIAWVVDELLAGLQAHYSATRMLSAAGSATSCLPIERPAAVANEPIVMARKPFKGTVAANVLEHGTGGINIDATRVEHANEADRAKQEAMVNRIREQGGTMGNSWANSSDLSGANPVSDKGRWPANVIMDEAAGEMLGEPARFFYCAKANKKEREMGLDGIDHVELHFPSCQDQKVKLRVDTAQSPPRVIGVCTIDGADVSGWSTFLFGNAQTDRCQTDTVSTTETTTSSITSSPTLNWLLTCSTSESIRDVSCAMESGGNHAGSVARCNTLNATTSAEMVSLPGVSNVPSGTPFTISACDGRANHHSTVKPISLMRYLTRLVTPGGGTCLDPFTGSGTTGIACKAEGFEFIGIELSEEYQKIALARIKGYLPGGKCDATVNSKEEQSEQLTIGAVAD